MKPTNLKEFEEWSFSSGVVAGDDFEAFAKMYRKFIKQNIPENARLVKFNRGHYYISGFIKRNNKYIYFSTDDVRYHKNGWAENILIRTAKNEQDYTGGTNHFCNLENFKDMCNEILG